MSKELTYWLALAHTPNIHTKRKNEIIVQLFEEGKSIVDFFELEPTQWKSNYHLDKPEVELFLNAKNELSNYAFLVEDLLEQGYHIIPITSNDYSPILKKNLGKTYAPPILYAKGNLQIMKEESVAIVGSSKANTRSLEFTDNIAKKTASEFKVVVSGLAKGVDKKAFDSALKNKGQSIIVLPQGIATFQSGFKKYYREIIEGNVLVLSTFHPKTALSEEFSMARNSIIYGLSSEIYIAESEDEGGSWSGFIENIREKRAVYVRIPSPREKNANSLLISKGGKAVDITGNFTHNDINEAPKSIVSEPAMKGKDKPGQTSLF